MCTTRIFAVLVLVVFSVQISHATTPPARVVSASFFDIGNASSGPMPSTAIAGAPPSQYSVPTDIRVSNWNNLPLQFLSVPGSNLDLHDSQGQQTTVDVDWIATDVIVGTWGGGILSGDSTMMNGAIQSTIQAPTDKIEINVRDLGNSFDLGAGYDVIIYADAGHVGSRQSLFVDDGITVGSAITMLDVVADVPPGRPFDPALDYDEGTFDGAGTWMRFSGLTGSSFTIEALAISPTPAFINGFQIVGYHPPGKTPDGDLDGNGAVTGVDFLEWQRGFSSGIYNISHLAEWSANYGAPGPVLAAAVPEPSVAALLVTAMTIVAGSRRRVRGDC